MNINNQFLAELAQQGVKLWIEGDQLRFRAPKGVMTTELHDFLVSHKAKLILLLHQSKISTDNTNPSLAPISRNRHLPLSFAQERMWFLSQLEPNNPFYNELLALRLLGSLNIVALEQGLNKIIARHESLRTNFITINGQPVQVIAESLTLTVPVVDLGSLSDREREIEVQRLATIQAQYPFNLASEPLIQANLLRLTEVEHVLLLKIHHIVWDGWSLSVLLRELATFYSAFCNNLSLKLAPLPIQYADFSVWHRQSLTENKLAPQLAYWKQQLLNVPALLELPTDRARGATQTFRGAHQRFALSKELTEALMSLSQRQRVTLFMTLLAAFQTLLHRYTGQTDICVGTQIANRDHAEIEGLIGFFVNTLVLRTDISGDPSFEDLLSRVREVTLGAYAHRDLPFEKLVEKLQPTRSLSYTPLVQVMLVLLNELPQIQMEGIAVSPLAVETATTRFDLTLILENTATGLIGEWEYNTDLFDAITIKRMAKHFQTLLEGIVANSQQQLSELPLLSATERQQLLVEWNDTKTNYPKDLCIHQLFEAQVLKSPDAVAVVFEQEQLTYRELNARSNQLAHHLKQLGGGLEVLVGIYIERSLEMLVGLLGILKAGCAYVPLDPAYPQERLDHILSDSQIPILLTQQKFIADLSEYQGNIVCLDTDWKVISEQSLENPCNYVTPNNLAYVIYTSGSTGKPKGVLIDHHNVVRLYTATQSWFNFNQSDVWTLFHSYAFDFSVWEIWGALFYGGRLIVVPYWISRSPDAFHELLSTEKVTVLNQTPSAFRQLIQVDQSLTRDKDMSLRLVIFGGEALDIQSLKPWFEKHGERSPQLVNMYGITETTVHVTYHPVQIADLNSMGSIIGSPIPDLQVYILDQHLQPLPIGVPGEMHIGGAGLARGYLNRPKLTTEKFISNPFSHKEGSRLYKSGDLARYLSDGNIEYLGRIDHQVKIRGFRIELGEIETLLSQHPQVRETLVIAHEDQSGDKRLMAYIVPNQEKPTISELYSFLQKKLPNYMIPSTFVLLDTMPLTSNGKVNRQALPAISRSGIEENFVASRTPIEEVLVAIWAEVLELKQVGIYDNFFAIGGDSIRVIQVVHEASKYNLSIVTRDVFEYQTIYSLAQYINSCKYENKNNTPPPLYLLELSDNTFELLPDNIEEAYPLARMQEFILSHYSNDHQKMGVYHFLQLFEIDDDNLSLKSFKLALETLVQKNPIFRTIFIINNVELPLQVVKRNLKFSVNERDISSLDPDKQEIYIDAVVKQDIQHLFNVEDTNEPLFRFWIFQKSLNRFELLISIHHAIIDGWSNIEILKELCELYLAIKRGEEIQLESSTHVYKEFVALEKEIIRSKEASDFWRERLKNYIYKPLQRFKDRTVDEAEAIYEEYILDSEIVSDLQKVCIKMKTSLKALFLSTYIDLIGIQTKENAIAVGIVTNGRNERLSDPFKSLGLFWNIVPFFQVLFNDKSLQIKDVQQSLIELEPYVRYPLLQILEDRQEAELFFSTFNFLHFHNTKNNFVSTGFNFKVKRFHDKFNFPLNYIVSIDPLNRNINIRVEYDKMYFTRQDIRSMANNYIDMLKDLK
ncbi:amino acid adenylation domain-containing protein [Coleofasciculus sp.]|uniref:amino acid adenylation domain-containing protein n=1 Tax=Coleofasciculus sp. TaxID=3100458 RepID=UPI003A480037